MVTRLERKWGKIKMRKMLFNGSIACIIMTFLVSLGLPDWMHCFFYLFLILTNDWHMQFWQLLVIIFSSRDVQLDLLWGLWLCLSTLNRLLSLLEHHRNNAGDVKHTQVHLLNSICNSQLILLLKMETKIFDSIFTLFSSLKCDHI